MNNIKNNNDNSFFLRKHKLENEKKNKNKKNIKTKKKIYKLTKEEKEGLKEKILRLEDHQRLQLYHFIKMDNIKYTKQQNGILLNLKHTTNDFIYKISTYINQCIENQKYRQIE